MPGEQLGGFGETLGDDGQLDGIIFEFCFLISAGRERGGEQRGEFVELGLNEISGVGAGVDEAAKDRGVFEEPVQACHAVTRPFIFTRERHPLRFRCTGCKARAGKVETGQRLIPREFPRRQRDIEGGNLGAAFVEFQAMNVVLKHCNHCRLCAEFSSSMRKRTSNGRANTRK